MDTSLKELTLHAELYERRMQLMLETKDWFLEVAGLVLDNDRSSVEWLRKDIHTLESMLAFHKLCYSLLSEDVPSVDDGGEDDAE